MSKVLIPTIWLREQGTYCSRCGKKISALQPIKKKEVLCLECGEKK